MLKSSQFHTILYVILSYVTETYAQYEYWANLTVTSYCQDSVYIFTPYPINPVIPKFELFPPSNTTLNYWLDTTNYEQGPIEVTISAADDIEGDNLMIFYEWEVGSLYWYLKSVGKGFGSGKIWVGTDKERCHGMWVDERGLVYGLCEEDPVNLVVKLCV